MATTLIFVHGTGVRMDTTHQMVRDGLAQLGRTDVDVRGVPWGDEYGVRLAAADLVSVLPEGSRDFADTGDAEAGLWSLLLDDPIFELRVIAIEPPAVGPAGGAANPLPGARPEDVRIAERLSALTIGGAPGGVNGPQVRDAAAEIAKAAVLSDAALAVADPNDVEFIGAVARAVTARALQKERGRLAEGPDALFLAEARHELVRAVETALSTESKGLGDWLKKKVFDFGLARATAAGRGRRTGLMQDASPGVGDILLYQRRGDAIGKRVLSAIADAPPGKPLVLLAHSLGGIILFDLLTGGEIDREVAHFITVGSQLGFFYKCDAMGTVRLGPNPKPFTPWLNIYDRNDMLSFRAGPAFGSPSDVVDLEVSSGSPFPESHGAYFHMPKVYEEIAGRCP